MNPANKDFIEVDKKMSGPKILLVIHDNILRPSFGRLFKALDCMVYTTATANDALVVLEKVCPNIVLLDMELEGMSANDFLRKIKENDKSKNIQVISYTKFLKYNIVNPEMLKLGDSDSELELRKSVLEILKNHISVVPGEVILWAVEVLKSKNRLVPVKLDIAARILTRSYEY